VVSSGLGPIYRRTVIRPVSGLGEPIELSDWVRGAATHRPDQGGSSFMIVFSRVSVSGSKLLCPAVVMK
jgi:hypothetical protein